MKLSAFFELLSTIAKFLVHLLGEQERQGETGGGRVAIGKECGGKGR